MNTEKLNFLIELGNKYLNNIISEFEKNDRYGLSMYSEVSFVMLIDGFSKEDYNYKGYNVLINPEVDDLIGKNIYCLIFDRKVELKASYFECIYIRMLSRFREGIKVIFI